MFPDASGRKLLLYQDPHAPPDARTEDLLARLTVEEKIALLGGTGFTTAGNERLGIPALLMADASMGVRGHGKSTAYANGLALAATWDVDLAERVGRALGRDCRARGVHILLGPGMNLYRAPMCGRNFEYLGEDPLLAGAVASAFVRGLQSQEVAATAKHFLANEQEVQRHEIDSRVDERALRELYGKPFDMVVRAGVRCVMASYNPVNGVHASQNRKLLTDLLKGELGFEGLLMSDWNSCYDAEGVALAGLDLEMPTGKFFNAETLLPLVASGRVPEEVIDDKVRRQLRVAFSMGWFDREQRDGSIPQDDPESAALALRGARECVTLLKNDAGLLPLDGRAVRKIVVLGRNAHPAVYGGGGSAIVDPFRTTSVFDGIKEIASAETEVVLVPWRRTPAEPASSERPEALDAHGAEGSAAIAEEFMEHVRAADAVVVCVGFSQSPPVYRDADPKMLDHEGENGDRSYELPPGQEELIKAASKLNKNTIVVLNAGGSVATRGWIERVPALLHAFYPGQDGGRAIAEILFGVTNPSGKLPFSWERRWEDCAAYGHYPLHGDKDPKNDYAEGIFLGYRWFDAKGIAPLFPFGFGLSYTRFELSELMLKEVPGGDFVASVQVRNVGDRSGAEVIQLYIEPPACGVPRPLRELKGFARVELEPGERAEVAIPFARADLAFWDPAQRGWAAQPGEYHAFAGSSSASLPLRAVFVV